MVWTYHLDVAHVRHVILINPIGIVGLEVVGTAKDCPDLTFRMELDLSCHLWSIAELSIHLSSEFSRNYGTTSILSVSSVCYVSKDCSKNDHPDNDCQNDDDGEVVSLGDWIWRRLDDHLSSVFVHCDCLLLGATVSWGVWWNLFDCRVSRDRRSWFDNCRSIVSYIVTCWL